MDAWIVAVGAVSSVPAETLMVCAATTNLAGGGAPPPPPPPHALSKKNAPQPVHLSTRADIPIAPIVICDQVCQMNEIWTLYGGKFIVEKRVAGWSKTGRFAGVCKRPKGRKV